MTPQRTGSYAENIAQRLLILEAGWREIGLNPVLLREAASLIRSQSEAILRYQSGRAYVIGHNDGWDAALATGVPETKPGYEHQVEKSGTCDRCGGEAGRPRDPQEDAEGTPLLCAGCADQVLREVSRNIEPF